MPTTVQVVNRYVSSDNVAGAAIVLDGAAIDAHSPRTRANGQVTVATELLADGDHVMHVVPDQTSTAPAGPVVAEGLAAAHADVPFTRRERYRQQGQNHGHKRAPRAGAERRGFGHESCSGPVAAYLFPLSVPERE
jgi:hypothetical protein